MRLTPSARTPSVVPFHVRPPRAVPASRRPFARGHRNVVARTWIAAAVFASGCVRPAPPPDDRGAGTPPALAAEHRLSTGVRLDSAGRSIPLGSMPLAAAMSPDGRYVVVSLSGWREQGLEVVSRATGAVVQRLTQPGAFVGLAWSADGGTLYASGGASDRVYVYAWREAATDPPARLVDGIALRAPGAA